MFYLDEIKIMYFELYSSVNKLLMNNVLLILFDYTHIEH